jgi:hypothetical protein
MFFEVRKHIDERSPHGTWRLQSTLVPAIAPATPAPEKQSIQPPRQTHLEPANAAEQGPAVHRLDHQMKGGPPAPRSEQFRTARASADSHSESRPPRSDTRTASARTGARSATSHAPVHQHDAPAAHHAPFASDQVKACAPHPHAVRPSSAAETATRAATRSSAPDACDPPCDQLAPARRTLNSINANSGAFNPITQLAQTITHAPTHTPALTHTTHSLLGGPTEPRAELWEVLVRLPLVRLPLVFAGGDLTPGAPRPVFARSTTAPS